MSWTKTPQEYPNRADVCAVSRSARWMLMELYSWSNSQLTNGRVPRSIIRRITDAEDPEADVAELLREGLLVEFEEGFLQLDWSNQEEAETVKTRARRNADKTKRSRQRKEMHLAGDHSICVAPYCKMGQSNATGNEEVTLPVTSGLRNGSVTGSVTPIRSSPVRSGPIRNGMKDKDKDQDGAVRLDSAGATSHSHPAKDERLTPKRPAVITAANLPGVDPERLANWSPAKRAYMWDLLGAEGEELDRLEALAGDDEAIEAWYAGGGETLDGLLDPDE